LEGDERLTHRGPADGELGRELTFRRQPVPDLETLRVDVVQQPLDELLVQPGASERAQRVLAPPGSCGHGRRSSPAAITERVQVAYWPGLSSAPDRRAR